MSAILTALGLQSFLILPSLRHYQTGFYSVSGFNLLWSLRESRDHAVQNQIDRLEREEDSLGILSVFTKAWP